MNTQTTPRRFVLEEKVTPDPAFMMLITLDALRALGGSATNQELVDRVIEAEEITEREQTFMMPNERSPRLNYYLRWACTNLKRGGAAENSARGVWALTETGMKLALIDEARELYKKVKLLFRNKSNFSKDSESNTRPDSNNETRSQVDGENDWQDTLLKELMKIDPSAFERLAQRLLRDAGFVKVEVRGKTGDGGIDGVGILRVNLVSFQIYFQCKRWTSSVGSKEIRDFRGALQGRADKGLFITTSSFTKQASDEATRAGAIAIDLIDGSRLCELLKQYGLGVTTETVERVIIQSKWLREI